MGTHLSLFLRERMEERHSDLAAFKRTTGIPLSGETLRRVIYLGAKPTGAVLVVIMKYLGFSKREIGEACRDSGETDLAELLLDETSDLSLSSDEEVVVRKLREFRTCEDAHLFVMQVIRFVDGLCSKRG